MSFVATIDGLLFRYDRVRSYRSSGQTDYLGKLMFLMKIIAPLLVMTLLGCEQSQVGFEGSKVGKEKDSASVAGNGAEAEDQAVPPTSISGAWLVCEWIDQPAGRGGCAIVDRDSRKLKIETMTIRYWKVVFRDGGAELNVEFALQQPTSPYHVIFQIISGQNFIGENLDIRYNLDGRIISRSLNDVFPAGSNPIQTLESSAVTTPLRDLTVPADKIGTLPEADRTFYLWPDPEKSASAPGANARLLAATTEGLFNTQSFAFMADGYCGAGGAVKSAIDGSWQTKLEEIAKGALEKYSVRPEIVKGKQSIFLPAWNECILPLRTANFRRTAQSADGSCMFMLIQQRVPPPGFSTAQPYLMIFTKRFADAVGFSAADLEQAAEQYPCN